MRKSAAVVAFLLVLGCSAEQPKSGWEYRPPHGAFLPWLYYHFDDGQGTVLIGSCKDPLPEPGFRLAGGDWDGPQFKLTVDGKSWILPTVGHWLPADKFTASKAPQLAIANAKHSIAFEVGKWRREMKPSAALTRFVADCRR